MSEIWKFEISHLVTDIQIPIGAEILCTAVQGESIFIWAKIDPTATTETRRFEIAGTGQPMTDKHAHLYIGTVHIGETDRMGALVWHIFERRANV